MTPGTSPGGGVIPVETPLELALQVHADLESALIKGLSGAPSSEDSSESDLPEDSDPSDVPGDAAPEGIEPAVAFDSDFESALLEGLSTEPAGPPKGAAGQDPPVRSVIAVSSSDPVSDPGKPGSGTVFEFESVPIEDLPDGPSPSSEHPGSTDLPNASEPVAASEDAVPASHGLDAGIGAEFEDMLLYGLSDAPQVSSNDAGIPGWPGDSDLPAEPGNDVPGGAGPAVTLGADFENALLEKLSADPAVPPEGPDNPDLPVAPTNPDLLNDAVPGHGEPGSGTVFEFESRLMDGLTDVTSASSDRSDPFDLSGAILSAAVPEVPVAGTDDTVQGAAARSASAPLDSLPDSPSTSPDDPERADPRMASHPAASLSESEPDRHMPIAGDGVTSRTDAGPEDWVGEEATADNPSAALAFATDSETEDALREGLLYVEGLTPGYDDPQVWPGGLRAAVATLAEGHSTKLVIVDIDGIPYPAGAIHEMAEVCEIGTVVIAVGSDDTARVSRELMLSGVSDYLVKPLSAQEVRDAASRAITYAQGLPARGRVAGFTGTGGSGTTTIATATALHAAEQGRYVSVLDLNRTVSAMALLLDVEPAAGLDQLFDVAGKTPPDPQMLDGVRARRSERISVYAYRLGPSAPPAPSPPALSWLLEQLKHRSQLVLVDGLDDPELRFALLAEADVRVLVAEPTAGGAVRAARILDLLGDGPPVLLVQNHTRAFKVSAGERLLLDAGIGLPPDTAIPYEASLLEIADRGWPRGRLPRRLRKPVATLWDGILAQAFGEHTFPAAAS